MVHDTKTMNHTFTVCKGDCKSNTRIDEDIDRPFAYKFQFSLKAK
jgi:hypothetical protein